MKLIASLIIAAIAILPLAACETQHSESTHDNLFGGQTHKESTTVENPITGETSVQRSTSVTH